MHQRTNTLLRAATMKPPARGDTKSVRQKSSLTKDNNIEAAGFSSTKKSKVRKSYSYKSAKIKFDSQKNRISTGNSLLSSILNEMYAKGEITIDDVANINSLEIFMPEENIGNIQQFCNIFYRNTKDDKAGYNSEEDYGIIKNRGRHNSKAQFKRLNQNNSLTGTILFETIAGIAPHYEMINRIRSNPLEIKCNDETLAKKINDFLTERQYEQFITAVNNQINAQTLKLSKLKTYDKVTFDKIKQELSTSLQEFADQANNLPTRMDKLAAVETLRPTAARSINLPLIAGLCLALGNTFGWGTLFEGAGYIPNSSWHGANNLVKILADTSSDLTSKLHFEEHSLEYKALSVSASMYAASIKMFSMFLAELSDSFILGTFLKTAIAGLIILGVLNYAEILKTSTKSACIATPIFFALQCMASLEPEDGFFGGSHVAKNVLMAVFGILFSQAAGALPFFEKYENKREFAEQSIALNNSGRTPNRFSGINETTTHEQKIKTDADRARKIENSSRAVDATPPTAASVNTILSALGPYGFNKIEKATFFILSLSINGPIEINSIFINFLFSLIGKSDNKRLELALEKMLETHQPEELPHRIETVINAMDKPENETQSAQIQELVNGLKGLNTKDHSENKLKTEIQLLMNGYSDKSQQQKELLFQTYMGNNLVGKSFEAIGSKFMDSTIISFMNFPEALKSLYKFPANFTSPR